MSGLNVAVLADPLPGLEPCGPDPEDDLDFQNVVARLEVMLPSSFFHRDEDGRQLAFDRGAIDFRAAFADLDRLCARSRDLRVLVLAAKLSALDRDVDAFGRTLAAIRGQLSRHWADLHPRPLDGDLFQREVVLQSLDELAPVVLPLQHAPILQTRRLGPLALRSHLVAAGEIAAVEGEEHADAGAIRQAVAELPEETLAAALAPVSGIREELAALAALWQEKTGQPALALPRLSALIDKMLVLISLGAPRIDPAVASTASDASVTAAPMGACRSMAEVRVALSACLAYFRRVEPSSPAVPLIAQAQQLIGRSLLEVVQTLFPEQAERAAIGIGERLRFNLPLSRLPVPEEDAAAADEWSSGSEPDGDVPIAAEAEPAAASRHEALAQLRAVASFYRQIEPSHPTPLLLDRACQLATQDFLALLRDILPELDTSQLTD